MRGLQEEHILPQPEGLLHHLRLAPALKITIERAVLCRQPASAGFQHRQYDHPDPLLAQPSLLRNHFQGLGSPDKIAYAMDLTMRFIPTFGRDFQLTMDAQRARGYELEKISGGLIAQVRKLGPLVVPVTIHAIIGSEDIIDAMDLRAFGIGPRTWLVKLHTRNATRTSKDTLALLCRFLPAGHITRLRSPLGAASINPIRCSGSLKTGYNYPARP